MLLRTTKKMLLALIAITIMNFVESEAQEFPGKIKGPARENPVKVKKLPVNECDLNGWIKQKQSGATGIISFVTGPGQPPLGKGSLLFEGADNKIIRIKNNDYNGLPLSTISELSFSTYVEQRGNSWDNAYIILTIDADNNGTVDFPLVFNTEFQTGSFLNGFPDQGQSILHTWQTWNLLAGGWWIGLPAPDPYHGGALHTLAFYIQQYPNAVIRNPAEPGPGGIRINGISPIFQGPFKGYVDNFIIATNSFKTIYDFEGDRVQVCHNGQNICIASSALAAHLAHEDYLGACTSLLSRTTSELQQPTTGNISLSVYPNPAKDETLIKYNLPYDTKISITVYDIMGKLVSTILDEKKNTGSYIIKYSINNLPPGFYYIKLNSSDQGKPIKKNVSLVVAH